MEVSEQINHPFHICLARTRKEYKCKMLSKDDIVHPRVLWIFEAVSKQLASLIFWDCSQFGPRCLSAVLSLRRKDSLCAFNANDQERNITLNFRKLCR